MPRPSFPLVADPDMFSFSFTLTHFEGEAQPLVEVDALEPDGAHTCGLGGESRECACVSQNISHLFP